MGDGGYMAVSPHSSDIVFCVGNVYNAAYFFAVSHTSNGATFERDTLTAGTRGYALAFDPVDPNRVYVGGDSAYNYPCLLITTDQGTTWTQSRTGLTGVIYFLAVDPQHPQVVYAGSSAGVFKSTNAGASWSVTSLTTHTKSIVIDPVRPQNLYAGTYGQGVHASTDGGTTWTAMNTGLTNLKVLSMSLRPSTENVIFAGTEGGSVFRTSLPTGISAAPQFSIPNSQFSIAPNPCHSATTVSLSSPLAPNSSLSLYDASGRFISSMPVRTSQFTIHTSQLPPGTYFVRLSSGRAVHTTRLTVLD